ncbi:MAG TPA: phage tail protein [Pyrinomonadaceae bacterium]|jgi:phage tail-like protein|nr:phage tail protein [Pyrinomonadaceae bacterium]
MPNSGARNDPFPAFRFTITFDDLPPGGFTDCSGLQMETEVQDYMEGGLNTHTWKFATRTKQTTLVLKRGIVNKVLWDWYHDISIGKMKFRNGTITVFDHDGTTQVLEYQVLQAFPTKWVGSELSASQSNLAVETVEFAHQGLERRK